MTYADAFIATISATVAILALHYFVTTRRDGLSSGVRPSLPWRLLSAVVIISVVGLASTALIGSVRGALDGWVLFAHLTFAGPFIGSVVLFAVIGLFRSRRRTPLTRVAFVALLASTLGTLTTIALSMPPLFGTEAMLELFHVHRTFGLALTVSALVYGYSALLERSGQES